LVAAQEAVREPAVVYHHLEVPDPLGTTVVASVRLGPFPSADVAQRVADAICAEVASDYLETGADWVDCVQRVLGQRYAHLVAPAS
jgi:hypothetical protein